MTQRSPTHILVLVPLWFAGIMLVPAVHGFTAGTSSEGRAFLYASILSLFGFGFARVAQSASPLRPTSQRNMLITLLVLFLLLPVILAVPYHDALQTTSFLNAYLDMVSAITTTGFQVLDPDRLSETLHLWRGLVAWVGGFLLWVLAWSIFMPLNLGGYEHLSRGNMTVWGRDHGSTRQQTLAAQRFSSEAGRLLPAYAGLSLLAFIVLLSSDTPPLEAAVLSMGVMSTSGIQVAPAGTPLGIGPLMEATLAVFFIFAVSRVVVNAAAGAPSLKNFKQDQELRMAAFLVLAVTLSIFFKHYIGATTVDQDESIGQALLVFWGALFTTISFLLTAGYVSEGWAAAQLWSGLNGSSLVLLGLALVGGGIATTAGGIKLLRLALLVGHTRSEMQKLISPSQVTRNDAEEIRATMMAWVFFMMFAVSLAAVLLLLAFSGVEFEDGIILTVASLSNTGPLTAVAPMEPIDFVALSDLSKYVLCVAMVVGRLETLVFVALLNPELWRSG